MKKKYAAPTAPCSLTEVQSSLCTVSGRGGGVNAGYGGVDEDGSLEPDARQHWKYNEEDDFYVEEIESEQNGWKNGLW